MRVLQVAHHFLPRHRAGAEIYTDGIARELQAQGHEVLVYATDDDPSRRPWSLTEEEQDGLSVLLLAHPREAKSPADTLGRKETDRAFVDVLNRFDPDVVHFQHVMYAGLSCASLARARGIPCVMTLHEYWLLCARDGQLRRKDDVVCSGPDRSTCARCLDGYRFGRTGLEVAAAGFADRIRRITGWNAFSLLKRMRDRRGAGVEALGEEPRPALLAFVDERQRAVEELTQSVDRFLCPSRFLLDCFRAAGWPEERLLHWPYGLGSAEDYPRRAQSEGPLRVGFMGTLTPWKGVDVLLDAHRRLPRGLVTVDIYGAAGGRPSYVARLLRSAAAGEVTFHGEFSGGASAALAGMDVLCVPSVWYENAPLVISEAFSHGVPVVTSGHGGMAEMVTDGKDGRTFDPGSSDDLARVLRELAEDRSQVVSLGAATPTPRTVEDDACGLANLYSELALES